MLAFAYKSNNDDAAFLIEKIDVKQNKLVSKETLPEIVLLKDKNNKYISKTTNQYQFVDASRQLDKAIAINELAGIDIVADVPINQFEFSPDGRYLALACGEPSSFWSVGYGMNEDGNGFIILYDTKENHIVYRTNQKERQFQHNVTEVKWVDDGN